MRKYFLHIFILVSAFTMGQTPGYTFVNGWKTSQVFQSGDSLVTLGVNIDSGIYRHRLNLIYSDNELNNSTHKQLYIDSTQYYSNHNAQVKVDKNIFLSGIYKYNLSSDTNFGFVGKYDVSGILKSEYKFLYGASSISTDIIRTSKNEIINVGRYTTDGGKYHGYYQVFDSNLILKKEKIYLCKESVDNNACREVNSRILESEDGNFLYYATLRGHSRPDIAYTRINKINRNGDILWTYRDLEDTFSYHNPIVTELSNGNILLITKRQYFRPYMNPDENNRLPTVDFNGSSFITILDKDGNFISKRDTRDLVDHFHTSEDNVNLNFLESERVIPTKDNGYVICGTHWVFNDIGEYAGFLLKVDSVGNPVWFRSYQFDACNAEETADQDIYLFGVTELDNGGFALAGRFICDESIDHGGGIYQPGIVIITNEYGCLEPDCKKKITIGLDELIKENKRTSIYPNPTSGNINIQQSEGYVKKPISKVEIYNQLGNKVLAENQYKEPEVLNVSSLESGVYAVRIYFNQYLFETHKLNVK